MREVREAAQYFFTLVKDYGDLLIMNRESQPDEREALLNDYIQNHVESIAGELKKINEGYVHLNVVEKISVFNSVENVYQHIKQLERLVLKKHKLGNMIRRRLP